jgi:hypothetical protein
MEPGRRSGDAKPAFVLIGRQRRVIQVNVQSQFQRLSPLALLPVLGIMEVVLRWRRMARPIESRNLGGGGAKCESRFKSFSGFEEIA